MHSSPRWLEANEASLGEARYRHLVPDGGSTAAEIDRALRAFGIRDTSEAVALYSQIRGWKLFDDCLDLFAPRADELGARMRKESDSGRYSLEPGALPIAKTVDRVLWALLEDGRVRGYGEEGGIYGPDAPFVAWFGDQVADFEYAWDYGRDTSWGVRTLGL